MRFKTVYLWDAAQTLFPQKWTNKTYASSQAILNHRKDIRNKGPLALERIEWEAYVKGWWQVSLAKGFVPVLSQLKNNIVFTTGIPAQVEARRKVYLKKYGVDIKDYLKEVITSFGLLGDPKDNTKNQAAYEKLIKLMVRRGYQTLVYTDDKRENCRQFLLALSHLKKLKKYKNLLGRVYQIKNDQAGLRKQRNLWLIGSLFDLLAKERKYL